MKKFLGAVSAVALLAAAGCGQSADPGPAGSSASSSPPAAANPVAVVAATNVYGDIARTIGGDAVAVTSIIDSPDKDPHEYEADARTQLALSKAQIVIENGGGYDDFVDTMLKASASKAAVLNASDISGYDQEPAEGEFNEHVWYDLPTVTKVSDQLVTELSTLAPDGAATFQANADAFKTKLSGLEDDLATLKKTYSGEAVAITEPVPLYLMDAAGLENKTPEEFSEAVEEDSDVPPAVLRETIALFSGKQVKLLAYNEQTTGPQTEAVLAAAKQASIPVVPVTETLPAGKDYTTWMSDTIKAVDQALGS